MARPDRWVSWKFDAVRVGLRMIKSYRPDAIWSTYPIATAHLIGAELHRRTGVPWLADFRGPIARRGIRRIRPLGNALSRSRLKRCEMHASACLLPRGRRASIVSATRKPRDRIVVIENGYDEESFSAVAPADNLTAPINPGIVTLLHSGVVYPSRRPNPAYSCPAPL